MVYLNKFYFLWKLMSPHPFLFCCNGEFFFLKNFFLFGWLCGESVIFFTVTIIDMLFLFIFIYVTIHFLDLSSGILHANYECLVAQRKKNNVWVTHSFLTNHVRQQIELLIHYIKFTNPTISSRVRNNLHYFIFLIQPVTLMLKN